VRKTIVLVTHDLDEAVRLGDRIAVLSQGGVLEQYATPAELLGAPASEFVREFVGTDRGIRRLAVTPIAESSLVPADRSEEPVVPLHSSLYDALAAMLTAGTDRVQVVDGGGSPLGDLTRDAVFERASPAARA
jgi:osmoprotectant transport system ATP-binding protein